MTGLGNADNVEDVGSVLRGAASARSKDCRVTFGQAVDWDAFVVCTFTSLSVNQDRVVVLDPATVGVKKKLSPGANTIEPVTVLP